MIRRDYNKNAETFSSSTAANESPTIKRNINIKVDKIESSPAQTRQKRKAVKDQRPVKELIKSPPICERVDYVHKRCLRNSPNLSTKEQEVSVVYAKKILHENSLSEFKKFKLSSTNTSTAEDPSNVKIKEEIADESGKVSEEDSRSSSKSESETTSPESENTQNVNNISNNINIILTLGNELIKRKNKTAKKSKSFEPPKRTESTADLTKKSSSETQTEEQIDFNKIPCKVSEAKNPLIQEDGPIEKLYLEGSIMIAVQTKTISYFECDILKQLISGNLNFSLIDRVIRKTYDEEADRKNYNRLCFNQFVHPIYIEMRGKQRELEDAENMCPNAFMYCQVYYVENKKIKNCSVHLDTVKRYVAYKL
jgi:hypothetical protein